MFAKFFFALLAVVAFFPPVAALAADNEIETRTTALLQGDRGTKVPAPPPTASSIKLREVFDAPSTKDVLPEISPGDIEFQKEVASISQSGGQWQPPRMLLSADEILKQPNRTRQILGVDILPATSTRLVWKPSRTFSGMAVDTPVLVVNGASDGPTLCLTAAIHGDELNGIEMIRRVIYDLDPDELHGTVIGVPIVNLLGFSRHSRYLPDRRDLNRYFPGNPTGSVASRIANAFFTDVMKHCDRLLDIHTGSFYRTNIPQLRANMNQPRVVDFVELFGDIPVLNSRGNSRSLRAAAVRAGIPTVTLEAGEPMRMQRDIVEVGVETIKILMAKSGMYSKLGMWVQPEPAFYDSSWVRADSSGILFSRLELGDEVEVGDVLGTVNNPISNEQADILSHHRGRILGMALDQFVMPGFAVYHIGIHAAKEELMAEEAERDELSDDPAEDELELGPGGLLREEDPFDDE
jgi:predicted deacylase